MDDYSGIRDDGRGLGGALDDDPAGDHAVAVAIIEDVDGDAGPDDGYVDGRAVLIHDGGGLAVGVADGGGAGLRADYHVIAGG